MEVFRFNSENCLLKRDNHVITAVISPKATLSQETVARALIDLS